MQTGSTKNHISHIFFALAVPMYYTGEGKISSTSSYFQGDASWLVMTNHWAGVSGKGQIKREKDIYHQGPMPKPIICHLPDPPIYSLPTTFTVNIFLVNRLKFRWRGKLKRKFRRKWQILCLQSVQIQSASPGLGNRNYCQGLYQCSVDTSRSSTGSCDVDISRCNSGPVCVDTSRSSTDLCSVDMSRCRLRHLWCRHL